MLRFAKFFATAARRTACRPMMFLSSIAALAGAVVCIGGCGVQSKLDDMHDATNDLRDTSRGIAKTSDLMSNAVEKGGTVDARYKRLDQIDADVRFGAKLSDSVIYFRSFQFQLWSSQTVGGLERREAMATDATKEFFRNVQRFMPFDIRNRPNAFAQAGDGALANRESTLVALAAALDSIDDDQLWAMKADPSLPRMTMLSMIEEALRYDVQVRAGNVSAQSLPTWVAPVLEFKEIAIYLLQARHNVAGVVALSLLSPLERDGTWAAFKMGCQKWTPDFENIGDQKLRDAKKYLIEGGRDDRDFLRSIGVEPEIDPLLKRIFSNVQTPEFAMTGEASGRQVSSGGKSPNSPAWYPKQPGYVELTQSLLAEIRLTAAVPRTAVSRIGLSYVGSGNSPPLEDDSKLLVGSLTCWIPRLF